MPVQGEPAPEGAVEAKRRGRRAWLRWLPLGLLVGLSLATYLYLRGEGIGFNTLVERRAWMVAQVEEHGFLAGLGLFVTCIAAVALSLPLVSVLTVFGGFLFGTVAATLWIVAGATIGSIVVFLVVRDVLHETLQARAGRWLKRMGRGFRDDAFSYLLVLRLLPIFPFWLVNLVPALLGVRFNVYVAATALGLIPGSIVFAGLGNGLGEMLDRGETPDFSILLDPSLLLPLLGLCVLALLPVAVKRLRRRRPA